MPVQRTLSSLALAMMALPLVLGLALYVVRPDRAALWAVGMLGVPVLLAVTHGWRRLGNAIAALSDESMFERRVVISSAVVCSCLVVALPMAARLSETLGVASPSLADALATRWTNVLAGGFLVLHGNRLPKILLPLANCDDPATVQAVRRRTGWTYSLAGLAFTVSWLALPVHLAQPIGFTILAAGVVTPALIMQVRMRRCFEQPAH